jgi:hypothetical protein
VKGSYDVTKVVAIGLEYYGSIGPFFQYGLFQKQMQLLFVATDLTTSPDREFRVMGFYQ